MKTKKFSKKLSLNKTTVSTLQNFQLQEIKGGGCNSGITCEWSYCDDNSLLVTCIAELCPC